MSYFPNQSPANMGLELRLRAIASKLPEGEASALYEIFTASNPSLVDTQFDFENNQIIAKQVGNKITFPRPLPMVKFAHISCGYEEWLKRKYSLPEFVEVEAGDTVIDCGAYVGGFSLSAARIASQLHAFEPELENFNCTSKNLEHYSNVTANQIGLYNKTQNIIMNISSSSVEHSILTPDDGPPVEKRNIKVVSLEDYCKNQDIQSIDFVKIEAEGVELEVFDGLGAIEPKKLAIDVSPERNSTSPAEEFKKRLLKKGYEIQQRAHVLFARQR